MNESDYLKRIALYRKLVYGSNREFAPVYALGRQCTWPSLSLFRDLMDWHVGNGHDPQDLSEVCRCPATNVTAAMRSMPRKACRAGVEFGTVGDGALQSLHALI